MPTSNDWLRMIYNVLAGGSAPGGGGSGGLTEAQTTAAVKEAIESATNLDQLEPKLDLLATKLDELKALQSGSAAAIVRVLSSGSPEYSSQGPSLKVFRVPIGKRWELVSGSFRFVSTATVGDRIPAIGIGGSFLNAGWSTLAIAQTQAPNLVYAYNLGSTYSSAPIPTVQGAATNFTAIVPMAIDHVVALSDQTIQLFDLQAIDAADSLSNSVLVVREFSEP